MVKTFCETTIVGVLVFMGSQLVGCQAGAGGAPHGIVGVGTTKPDLFGLPAEYRALHAALEQTFGRPVRFNAQPNGRAIGQQLEQGSIAFAIMSAAEYSAAQDSSKLNLLATAKNPLGNTSRKAHIITRASDTRFKGISDCAGKRFAFGTYGDALTDTAAQKTLEANGVPAKKLLPELLLPPPLSMEGRLYATNAANAISLDLTVNAGVIDEVMFNRLPDTGGNPLIGPSKDQFKIIGDTSAIPELAVVAGPSADAALTEKLTAYLLNEAKNNKDLCQQLGISGFGPADRAAYDAAANLLKK